MDEDNLKGCALIAVLIIILVVMPIGCIAWHSQRYEVTATVNKAERVSYGSGKDLTHKYLVFTDEGTFQCSDDWWLLKFNSSDVYGKIKEGKKYKFHLVGWRFALTSTYPNVVYISNPIEQDDEKNNSKK